MSLLPFTSGFTEREEYVTLKRCIAGSLVGLTLPILIPYVHFGIVSHLWDQFNYRVDKIGCTCPCWDTIFKGRYERGPSGYKNVYFNITSNTFYIWVICLVYVILLYEVGKKITVLALKKQLRLPMLLLLAVNIFPHYYSWWAFFNYLNDDYYRQWYHQLFFTLTEMVSTFTVAHLLDKNTTITPEKLLIIFNVGLLHVCIAAFDQLVDNLIKGNGELHQVLRDLGFLAPDLLQLLIPYLELQKKTRKEGIEALYVITNRAFFTSVAFVLSGWLFALYL